MYNFHAKPTEARPVNVPAPAPAAAPAPRPPLARADSRPYIPPPQQAPRPGPPPAQPQRPQFQPGGPVTALPPAPRPPSAGAPPLRAPPPGSLPYQPRAQPLARPSGPQSFAPQQPPRPQGPPPPGVYQQRAPPPSGLQFGPRQPPQPGVPSTPEGPKGLPFQPPNGLNRAAAPPQAVPRPPPPAQLSRQSSQGSLQGSEGPGAARSKPVNLEDIGGEKRHVEPPENGVDHPGGAAKSRSFSIAAAPGAPSPLKMEDDRRKSVSSIGGRGDEPGGRGPTLGLIEEGKPDAASKAARDAALRGSRESVRSDASDERRPDSRLSGSRMSESFVGSFDATPKKKLDDDDDVVLQNSAPAVKRAPQPTAEARAEPFDRSSSLSRSDSSPERKTASKPTSDTVVGGPKSLISSLGNPPDSASRLPPKTAEVKHDYKVQEAKAATPPKKNSPAPAQHDPRSLTQHDTKSPVPTHHDTKSPVPIHHDTKSPVPTHHDTKSPMPMDKKPPPFSSPIPPNDSRKPPRSAVKSATKQKPKDGDNDSGVDESTQGHENGSPGSPGKKSPSKIPSKQSNGVPKPSLSRSSSKSAAAKTPENPPPPEKKKVPMNKIQVGHAPSPNIKAVKSKIGSLENTTYKPGGGKVKIENRKLDFNNAAPKIAAKNDTYQPGGGVKKIPQTKLQWNAKSKIGSLENTAHKPGGGDKKIETVKLEFKDKAKPKVASTVNITHKPGGGAVKIENQKLEFKAQSKVGSLDNVKHKPGGGEVKIFDDKEYVKQMSGQSAGSLCQSGQEAYGHISLQDYVEEAERPMSRCKSARPSARSPSPRRKLHHSTSQELPDEYDFVARNNERNRMFARPKSARLSARRVADSQRPPFRCY